MLNQPDPAAATGSAPQKLITKTGLSLFTCDPILSICLYSATEHVSVLCPTGDAGADVMSWEAEGQQGLEPGVQKVNSIRQNSLDIFSPARDG